LNVEVNFGAKGHDEGGYSFSLGTSVTNATSRPGFVLFGMGRHDETEKPSPIRAQIRISEGLNLDRTGALSDVYLND
jgi:hypothetical protein